MDIRGITKSQLSLFIKYEVGAEKRTVKVYLEHLPDFGFIEKVGISGRIFKLNLQMLPSDLVKIVQEAVNEGKQLKLM
ncbi:hypothetical protein GWO13_03715 [Candidatus Bathyarchaeota archaeon]|nr:hypothetical protein [Candidatus Bathyarchaeota archaeon]